MGEFVLVVEFEVQPENLDKFNTLIAENARKSVANEPGCLQFDVVRAEDAPHKITLYEVYADKAAFESHGKQAHVAEFFKEGRPLLTSQKATRYERLSANAKT